MQSEREQTLVLNFKLFVHSFFLLDKTNYK